MTSFSTFAIVTSFTSLFAACMFRRVFPILAFAFDPWDRVVVVRAVKGRRSARSGAFATGPRAAIEPEPWILNARSQGRCY